MLQIILFIVLSVLFIWAILNKIGNHYAEDVPYIPLSKRQLRNIQEFIKFNHEDRVVDLGCGDGRVLRFFEKQGVKSVEGYEINLWAYAKAQLYNFFTRSKTKVFLKNFKQVDLSKYNVIFVYLLPNCLANLSEQLRAQLRPGTKIISYNFEIKDWTPSQVLPCPHLLDYPDRILVYEVGEDSEIKI